MGAGCVKNDFPYYSFRPHTSISTSIYIYIYRYSMQPSRDKDEKLKKKKSILNKVLYVLRT